MSLSTDASQLASLLVVLTQPDTEAIRQTEQALKPLLKDPRCVPALVEILKSKDSQVSARSHFAQDTSLATGMHQHLPRPIACFGRLVAVGF